MILNSDWLVTVSTADRVTPLYVAEIVAVPDAEELIVTSKAPVELLAGMVTLGGTVAMDVLLLDSVTVAPPDGVRALKDKVADVRTVPVCTVEGLSEIESRVVVDCGAGGVTVMVAVRVTPLYVADTTEVVVDDTTLVETDAVALLTPAGTVKVAGTDTVAGALLDSATAAPPLGAAAVSVTVAVALAPPCTLEGLRLIEPRAAVGGGGGGVDTVHPDSRAFTAVADPSFTSTVQSAGAVYPDRSILKLPEPSLVAICTPSTVIARFAVALPSIRSLVPLTSARDTLTAAWAAPARATNMKDISTSANATRYLRLLMTVSPLRYTLISNPSSHDSSMWA